jgi:hypothetical protein
LDWVLDIIISIIQTCLSSKVSINTHIRIHSVIHGGLFYEDFQSFLQKKCRFTANLVTSCKCSQNEERERDPPNSFKKGGYQSNHWDQHSHWTSSATETCHLKTHRQSQNICFSPFLKTLKGRAGSFLCKKPTPTWCFVLSDLLQLQYSKFPFKDRWERERERERDSLFCLLG